MTSMTKAIDDEQELLEKQSHLESHKAILDSNILNLQNHVKTVTFFSLKGLPHKNGNRLFRLWPVYLPCETHRSSTFIY
jgi:hypothetical protein